MRLKFFVFFLMFGIVGFPVFSAVNTESGSSTLGKPSVKFKSWQVGRSDVGTDPTNIVHTSFITSTQEECRFTASVVYDGNQGDNVSPIDVSTISWTVIHADPSSMALDTASVKKNWSGSKHPSKLDPSTSFNVVGTISVPAVVGSRTVTLNDGRTKQVPDYLGSTSCSHNDANRPQRVPRHRNNTKLGFTLVFSARTEDGQDIKPAELVLKADDIDQVRQEYVDYNRPIPDRTDGRWWSEDHYDFGHYKIMLNIGLGNKLLNWVAEINKLKGTDVDAFAMHDFLVTSGYRNPHHNFDHSNSTALLSSHMYGYALDVRGKSDAQGNLLDIDGDEQNTGADREVMVKAAKATGSRDPIVYSTKHVHADWAPGNWADRKKTSDPAKTFSLPPQGTDQPLTAAPAPPASLTGDCGIHTISASQTANHASVNFACASHTYYACQTPLTSETNRHSYQTLPCGSHSGYRCTAPSSHTQTTTCPSDSDGQSCSYGSYYACSPHTHAYPELPANPPPPPTPTVLCGNRWRGAGACMYGRVVSSSSTEHQATCSTHGTYWSCNPTAYARHGQTHTCRRPGCGATYTNCVKGNGTCTGGTYKWHN